MKIQSCLILLFLLLGGAKGSQGCGCHPLGNFPEEYQTCGGNRYDGLPFASRSPVYAKNMGLFPSHPFSFSFSFSPFSEPTSAYLAPFSAPILHNLSLSPSFPPLSSPSQPPPPTPWPPKLPSKSFQKEETPSTQQSPRTPPKG